MIRNYPVTYRVDTDKDVVSLIVGAETVSQIPLDESKTTLEDIQALLGIKAMP